MLSEYKITLLEAELELNELINRKIDMENTCSILKVAQDPKNHDCIKELVKDSLAANQIEFDEFLAKYSDYQQTLEHINNLIENQTEYIDNLTLSIETYGEEEIC